MKRRSSDDGKLEQSITHRLGDQGRLFLDEYREQIESIADSDGGSYYDKAQLTAGIITDDFMWNYYDGAMNLVYLDPKDYRSIIDGGNLDLVIYVTCWRGMGAFKDDGKPENSHYYAKEGLKRAAAVLKYAKSRGVPVVFQSIEDPPSYDRFLPLAELADFIFTTAEEKVPCYVQDTGNANVAVLKYGVSPRLHNPIGVVRKRSFDALWNTRSCLFAGSWYKNFPGRCASTRRLFDAVLAANSGLYIADRKFKEPDHAYWAFPLKYSEYIMPAFHHEELQKVHKLFDFTLNLNTVTYSRTMCAMRIFEVQALGGLILSNYSRSASLMFPGVFQAYSSVDVDRVLNGYTEDELLNMQVEGIRSIWSSHTVYDRLNEMFDFMGKPRPFSPRKVACICEDGDFEALSSAIAHQFYSGAVLLRRSEVEFDATKIEGFDYAIVLHSGCIYPHSYLLDFVNTFKYVNVAYVRYADDLKGAFEYEQGVPDAISCMVDLRKINLLDFLHAQCPACRGFRIAGEKWGRDTSREKKIIGIAVPVVGNAESLAKRCFRSLLRSSVFGRMRVAFLINRESDSRAADKARELAANFDNVECFEESKGCFGRLDDLFRVASSHFSDLSFIGILDSNSEAINDGYAVLLEELASSGADAAVAVPSLPHEELGVLWDFKDADSAVLGDCGDSAIFRQTAMHKDGVLYGAVRVAKESVATVRHEGRHVCGRCHSTRDYAYDASVIVPAHNAERFLTRCLNSVASQATEKLRIQIIVVDDGSTDATARVAEGVSFENGDVLVLCQENAGVSAARNRGIEYALGEQIFFLDADDEFLPGTIFAVVDFMRANADRVDVVAFPRFYCEDGSAERRLHERDERLFEATGIYELEDNPFLALSTINICVKRDLKVRFDETMSMGEDQCYITQCLAPRARVGYVREAGYICYTHSDSSSSLNNYPYRCFGDMQILFRMLDDMKRRQPCMAGYCDGLILYNFGWRIAGDLLLPYHLKGEAYDEALAHVKRVVRNVDVAILNNCPWLNTYSKAWLVRLRGDADVLVQDNTVSVAVGKQLLFSVWKVAIAFSLVRVEGDSLRICGHFDDIPSLFMTPFELYAVVNGRDRVAVPLFRSVYAYRWTKMKLSETPGFDFSLNRYFVTSVSFEIVYQGLTIQARLSSFSSWTGIAPAIRRPYVDCDDVTLIADNDTIQVRSCDSEWSTLLHKGYENFLKTKKKKTRRLRHLLKATSAMLPKCWLYNDSQGRLQDSYLQFKHDFSKDDGVARYYIYTGEIPEGVSDNERHHMVKFGSSKHKILLFSASVIVTSYADDRDWMPFSRKQTPYYLDLLHATIVYVGHGVMHASLPRHLDREMVPWIDRFVVSTAMERNACVDLLHYRSSELLCTGSPRLRSEPALAPAKRVIAFIPSWRSNLTELKNGAWRTSPLFENSSYYRGIQDLLNSHLFHRFLVENDLVCQVKLHPGFSDRDKTAICESDRVHFVDALDLDECLMAITDFSSYQFDFLYRGCPVVYYLVDRCDFDAGVHSYRQLLYDIEKGFGEYTETVEGCVDALNRLARNSFKPLPIHEQRIKDLFLGAGDHAEELYGQLGMIAG